MNEMLPKKKIIGFSMGTLSIEGYNTEYRGFLPTNDIRKLELTFCCREDANSPLSQTLPKMPRPKTSKEKTHDYSKF
jgi:hypothetical protein